MRFALVYGGSGALGDTVVKAFKTRQQWKTVSVDLTESKSADWNILLTTTQSLEEQSKAVKAKLSEILSSANGSGGKLDAIVCVAGGWAGGNAADESVIHSSELMWKQSVHSSLVAAHVASTSLKLGGFLCLTGAKAAVSGTPGMIGYGMAKAAVHQLTKSLAGKGSGLPENSKVAAILPITLDTPANRGAMPKADFTSWTSLETLANKLVEWSDNHENVQSGTLYEVVTKAGHTDFSAL